MSLPTIPARPKYERKPSAPAADLAPLRLRSESFSHPLLNHLGVQAELRMVAKGALCIEYLKVLAVDPTEATPIAGYKGFIATTRSYLPLFGHMARQGRDGAMVVRAKSLRQTRRGQYSNGLKFRGQATALAIEDMRLRDADVEKADVFGHSMGVLSLSKMVARRPDLVRSCNAVAGAGMNGPARPLQLAWNFVTAMPLELAANREALERNLGHDGFIEIAQQSGNSYRNIPSQAGTCLIDDSRPNLKQATKAGIPVGLTAFGADALFDGSGMQQANRDYIPEHLQLYVPGAPHVFPQTNPEAHAAQQVDMFSQLNTARVIAS